MSERSAKTAENTPLFVIMSLISVALCAMSGKVSLAFPLVICAALCAHLFERPGGLPFALGAALLGGAAGYLTGGALFSAESVAFTVLPGAVILACRRRRAGLFTTSVAVGGAHLLLTAAFLALSLYLQYGDAAAGARTVFREIYASAGEMIKNMFREGDTYRISDADVSSLLSTITTMLPGIILAAWQVIGGAVYFIMKLLCSLAGGKTSAEDEYRIPDSPIIFFAVSLLISLILTPFEGAQVARIAAIDICIALSVPSAFCGIAAIVCKIKHPQTVTLPDGTVVRRFPFLPIAVMVASAFINPFMPFGVAAVYGSALTLKNAVKKSINKKDG